MSGESMGGTERSQVVAVDLFCGAGGFSEGLRQATEELNFDLRHAAVNHWDTAVETHERNHPEAHQYQSKVEQLHPPDVVERLTDGEGVDVDLLVGGPSCTHFSRARGGKPVNEQLRMSPWHVLNWLELLDADAFIIENVPEIQQWGRVDEDGMPVRDGSIFDAWTNALNALGYAVDWTQLVAANYGDPTTRERFFIIGRKHGSVTFPDTTHGDEPGLPDHRTAAEIIDWSDLGESIWTRDLTQKRVHSPPKDTTMQRIAEGIRRHCSDDLGPFADVLDELGRDEIRDLRENRAVPAHYAATAADALDEPFLVRYSADAVSSETSLVKYYGTSPPQPVGSPIDTVTANGLKYAVSTADSILLRQQDGGHPWSVSDRPIPTIATKGAHAIATPSLVMPKNGTRRGLHSNPLYPADSRPHHTVTADPRAKLVSPYLAPLYNPRSGQRPRTRSVDRPLMTVPASKSPAAVTTPRLRPFIDDYEGPAKALDSPLGTITSRDRFALCVPELWPWGLDVRYRMLQPDELKQAQGFPRDYDTAGTKADRTKQIGNAVPVGLAKSLCKHVLTAEDPSLASYGGGLTETDDIDIPEYHEVATDGGCNGRSVDTGTDRPEGSR